MSSPIPKPSDPPPAHKRTSASANAKQQPAFSPKSLNAFAVNQLSRGGSPRHRAPQISKGNVPGRYQSTARRVTLALVAAPIAIVTSYVMWQRVVLGEERKKLVKDGEDS